MFFRFGSLTSVGMERKVGGLQMVKMLAEDEEAVAGALHAVNEVCTNSPRSSHRAPARAFAPLYPPGRLLWLLGTDLRSENQSGSDF